MYRTLHCFILSMAMLAAGCEPEDDLLGTDATLEVDLGTDDASFESDEGVPDPLMMSGCTADEDCESANLTCFMDNSGLGGLCAECLDNTYCPDERPYCGADNRCQAQSQGICRDPLDCQDASRALCAFEEDGQIGTCVECGSDADCVRPRPFCSATGSCVGSEEDVPCDANADECGVLRTCVDGACLIE